MEAAKLQGATMVEGDHGYQSWWIRVGEAGLAKQGWRIWTDEQELVMIVSDLLGVFRDVSFILADKTFKKRQEIR